jgi:hypothetical protein
MRYLLTILAALVLCAPAFGQVKQRAYYSNTINGQLVHVRAVNYGPIGNTIVVTNLPNAAVFESVDEWNASNPSNQVVDVGSTQQILGTNQYTFALSNGFLNTVKALSYITNTGEVIADTGTNALKFTNAASFDDEVNIEGTYFTDYQLDATAWNFILNWEENYLSKGGTIAFRWFHDGATGFFLELPLSFIGTNAALHAAQTRTNLGLGGSDIVTFAGLTNNGDITINQTATNNGLLYIRRTNAEPFLGLANLIASNNTTISNETLFRVGVAEATNRSAQFGFRSTNTNGDGVAVFSVFGYNALMMIGPSDPAAGTNPIQATIYSVAPTNKVMTLITTNTGAMLMHRPIGIDTAGISTNAPANTTNVAGWIQFYVGTNSVRVPYYQ